MKKNAIAFGILIVLLLIIGIHNRTFTNLSLTGSEELRCFSTGAGYRTAWEVAENKREKREAEFSIQTIYSVKHDVNTVGSQAAVPLPEDYEGWNRVIKKYLDMTLAEIEAERGREIDLSKDGSMVVFEPTVFFPMLPLTEQHLIVLGSMDKSQKPAYVVLYDDVLAGYLDGLGLENGMDFGDMMDVLGERQAEASRLAGGGCNYRIVYERDGLILEFISDFEDGHLYTLFVRNGGSSR